MRDLLSGWAGSIKGDVKGEKFLPSGRVERPVKASKSRVPHPCGFQGCGF